MQKTDPILLCNFYSERDFWAERRVCLHASCFFGGQTWPIKKLSNWLKFWRMVNAPGLLTFQTIPWLCISCDLPLVRVERALCIYNQAGRATTSSHANIYFNTLERMRECYRDWARVCVVCAVTYWAFFAHQLMIAEDRGLMCQSMIGKSELKNVVCSYLSAFPQNRNI